MSPKEHPYKNLERLKAWKILEKAVQDLAANGDLEELTARPYIVGYLLDKLQEAHALNSHVNGANSVPLHPRPQPANRG